MALALVTDDLELRRFAKNVGSGIEDNPALKVLRRLVERNPDRPESDPVLREILLDSKDEFSKGLVNFRRDNDLMVDFALRKNVKVAVDRLNASAEGRRAVAEADEWLRSGNLPTLDSFP